HTAVTFTKTTTFCKHVSQRQRARRRDQPRQHRNGAHLRQFTWQHDDAGAGHVDECQNG
ncbi:hypothetical protein D021_3009B, partial [Vibrio parahaemolyticus 10296]